MLNALYTAASGMDASSTDLSVIGNNIANMNTVGFQESEVNFGDVLSQSLSNGGITSQVGLGVDVMNVSPIFSEGTLETESNPLDMAINGDGMFMVNQGNTTYYTTAGQFSLDQNGNIVNPDGAILQGYLANATGDITGTIGNLNVGEDESQPSPTSTVSVSANLDATATPPASPFTLNGNGTGVNNDPANYNSSNSVTVYDSQGGAHQITQYFVNTGPNAWTVNYVEADPANPGDFILAGTQDLTFNANGSLKQDNSGTPINFTFGGAVTTPQAITFNYGGGTADGDTGLNMSTQFGSSGFSVSDVTQNGYASGSLQSVSVSNAGVISGVFTNGQTQTIGQVALSRFMAEDDLTSDGSDLYSQSTTSGAPIVGTANSSGLGTISSSTLEESNVDLDDQFVDMITAQRSYEANSKVITTTDEMLSDLVNMISG